MLRLLRRFRKADSGVAAMEFGLILPVLFVLIVGIIEVTSALECRQKVTAVASQGADLVAQYTTISSAQVSDVFSAMSEILYTFPSNGARIVVTSVLSNGTGGGTVAWSQGSSGATARTANSTVSLPSGLMPAYVCSGGTCTGCAAGACSVIMSEISYNYASYSNTTKFITGTLTLTDSFYAKPRRSVSVAYSG